MAIPTFNGFSLNDSNFIAERITFKGYADRSLIRGKINRREGIKLIATEFGEKEIKVAGIIIAASSSELQSLVDNMKKELTVEEGALIVEAGRTFTATVAELSIPDEHYNITRAPFEVTFICSNPFAVGSLLTVTTPVVSGIVTFSGLVTISGTLFARPIVTYTPPVLTGNTLVRRLDINHIPTGQSITISGFGSGTPEGLGYQNSVTINFDDFSALEGTSAINTSGAFPRWEPGNNEFTVTVSGRNFPGGSVTVSYQPRYL